MPRRPFDEKPPALVTVQSPPAARCSSTLSRWQQSTRGLTGSTSLPREAAQAEQHEAEAQASVDAVAEHEGARLGVWTANPVGPMPAPLSADREAALAKLADAHRHAASRREQAEAVAPHYVEVVLQQQELDKRHAELVDAAVLEEAALLAQEYYSDVARMNARLSAPQRNLAGFQTAGKRPRNGDRQSAHRRWR